MTSNPTRAAIAQLRQRPEFRFAATTDDFADALAVALSTTPAPLDAMTLAVAMNDAQIDPSELRPGRDLLPVAERIVAVIPR